MFRSHILSFLRIIAFALDSHVFQRALNVLAEHLSAYFPTRHEVTDTQGAAGGFAFGYGGAYECPIAAVERFALSLMKLNNIFLLL